MLKSERGWPSPRAQETEDKKEKWLVKEKLKKLNEKNDKLLLITKRVIKYLERIKPCTSVETHPHIERRRG